MACSDRSACTILSASSPARNRRQFSPNGKRWPLWTSNELPFPGKKNTPCARTAMNHPAGSARIVPSRTPDGSVTLTL